MDRKIPRLSIVVPCFNEEELLLETAQKLSQEIDSLAVKNLISSNSFITFVDDGSTDSTWSKISKAASVHEHIRGIRLAKNSGHQTALIAGLEHSHENADVLISIDADLQDDVAAMEQMLIAYTNGYDIVYGVRTNRDVDSFFKRTSAHFFYTLMQLLGVHIIYNHADFRLTSSRVVQHLLLYTEKNLFLRGIFPEMGFSSTTVGYERKPRTAGTTKYPFFKMLGLALDGISSFSIQPLRMIMILGLVILLACLGASAYVVYAKYHLTVVPGWSSLILSIYFLGGVQLFSIGLLGEYLGKVYREVKNRPRYLVSEEIQ